MSDTACLAPCDLDVTAPEHGILVCDNECLRPKGHIGEHDCWSHRAASKEAKTALLMFLSRIRALEDRIAELEKAVNLALYVDLEADNSAYQEVLRLFGKEVTDPNPKARR